jgi:uncharacterized protein (DUF433 family)
MGIMVMVDTDVNIKDLVEVDPEKMSGTPCFIGTRVPVTHLFDYLEAGDSLDYFLKDFPSVTRDQGARCTGTHEKANPHRV